MVPAVKISYANYENVTADCPFCGYKCIFNRASDLRTFEPIGGEDIRCLNEECHRPFRIIGDTVNERHQVLIADCYQLLERKHYIHCIVNLVTAYEMFFSLFLRVKLLYKPFALEGVSRKHRDEVNVLAERLSGKIEKYTFHSMRKLFLSEVISRQPVTDLCAAKGRICALKVRDTPNYEIKAHRDKRLVPLLMKLKCTDINKMRNKVVHKQAYRPTKDEVERYFEEAKVIVGGLTFHLGLRNDLGWHIRRSRSP